MGKDSSKEFGKDNAIEQSKGKDAATQGKYHRRLQDAITSKNPTRKLNLDRRSKNSERRTNAASTFNGKARRFTIDRRLNNKDRREDED